MLMISYIVLHFLEIKLVSVQIATLHLENIFFCDYFDYFLVKGRTFTKHTNGIHKTMVLYDESGFFMNLKMSQIFPKHRILIFISYPYFQMM